MSLLLDALKKAEKAKQEAQRDAKEASAVPDAFSLAPKEEPRHVVTRDELPDITRSPDIHSEDLDSGAAHAAAAQPEPMYAEPRRPVPPPERPAARRPEPPPEPEATERAAAKKVFEAKFREPNPKLPFYITMVVLGIAVIGTGVYFYLQLRPPPPLVNTNPAPGSQQAAPASPGSAEPAPAPARVEETAAPVIPGLPQASAPSPASPGSQAAQGLASPSPAAKPAEAAPRPPAAAKGSNPAASAPNVASQAASEGAPRPAPRARGAATGRAQPADEAGSIASSRPVASVNPRVAAGYAAYLRGDLGAARDSYQQAIKEEPNSRDALLGLAAIETAAQRFDVAESYYQRLLQADPRDGHAQAGIIALRGPLIDPVAAESRMKSLLVTEPDAAALNFTLGNQLAQQSRWSEAQQAYFKAFSADPDNPDVAYNLAVSLDHLRQPALALQYYRRALALAERRAANFSPLAARNRIADLER